MLEVITGSMYSGKTEELMRRMKRYQIAGYRTVIIKPSLDNRYSSDSIATHDFNLMPCKIIDSLEHLTLFWKGFSTEASTSDLSAQSRSICIGIDEVQFYPSGLTSLVNLWANQGHHVVVAGLNMTSDGLPFGPMPDLLSTADKIVRLYAVCTSKHTDNRICGQQATHSIKVSNDATTTTKKIVDVGSFGKYEARCRTCWNREARGMM